jgi:hypothetical protein
VLDRPHVLIVFARHSPFRLLFVGALAHFGGMRNVLSIARIEPMMARDLLSDSQRRSISNLNAPSQQDPG